VHTRLKLVVENKDRDSLWVSVEES